MRAPSWTVLALLAAVLWAPVPAGRIAQARGAEQAPTAAELAAERNTPPMQGGLYVESAVYALARSLGIDVAVGNALIIGGSLVVACACVLGFIFVFALFAVWMERKVSAHIQCRLGPMEVGPHGLLQTFADGMKLLVKEDVIPRLADRPIFIIDQHGTLKLRIGGIERLQSSGFGDDLNLRVRK